MAARSRRVEYYRTEVEDRAGQAYELLSHLASHDVNLLAVSMVPVGPTHTQFTLFPESSATLIKAAERLGLVLFGPHSAILVQGDDRLGALLDVHRTLANARINVYATSGVTVGDGHYGYVIYVRPEDFENTANVLEAR